MHTTPHDTIDPIVVHWDRTVIHPQHPTDDTIVCCLTTDSHPVALMLDNELREALGLQLVDPDRDNATDTPLTGWATDMTEAGLEPYSGTLTLDGDDKPFLRLHFAFAADMDEDRRAAFITEIGKVILRAL